MTKKSSLMAFAFVMAIASATAAFAGTGYPMKCEHCGFEAKVMMGGGMRFKQLTGFCVKSGKFVYLHWGRDEKKPEPIAKIWNFATGKTLELYKCPECSHPFLPVQVEAEHSEGPGFDRCPKCGKATFHLDKSKGIIMYD